MEVCDLGSVCVLLEEHLAVDVTACIGVAHRASRVACGKWQVVGLVVMACIGCVSRYQSGGHVEAGLLCH